MIHYKNTEQISEPVVYEYVQPRYAKSTTDPTYYEPAATRIANMKKASGMIMEGLYDFYSKDDVSKFNEKNFSKNIHSAEPDYSYVKGLTQEEISQVATNYEEKVEKMIDKKEMSKSKKTERIQEQLEVNEAIKSKNEASTEDSE